MITLEKIPETEVLFLKIAGSEILLTDGSGCVLARQECQNPNHAATEIFELLEVMTFEGKSIRMRGGFFPRVELDDNDLYAVAHRG